MYLGSFVGMRLYIPNQTIKEQIVSTNSLTFEKKVGRLSIFFLNRLGIHQKNQYNWTVFSHSN